MNYSRRVTENAHLDRHTNKLRNHLKNAQHQLLLLHVVENCVREDLDSVCAISTLHLTLYNQLFQHVDGDAGRIDRM